MSHQNDNLINQKSFTTKRNAIVTGLAFQPLAIWNFNLNMNYMTMGNNAPASPAKVDFKNRGFNSIIRLHSI